MKLAKLIKTHREKKGLSQTELGRALGFKGGQYISNIERGNSDFPIIKIKKCAEILDIDPKELLDIVVKDRVKGVYKKAKVRFEKKCVNDHEEDLDLDQDLDGDEEDEDGIDK